MDKVFNARFIFVLIVTALCLYFVWPTFDYFMFVRSLPEEPTREQVQEKRDKLAEANMIKLGLDLQGGVEFLIQVDTDQLVRQNLRDRADSLRRQFQTESVDATVEYKEDNNTIDVKLDNPTDDAKIAADVLERQSSVFDWDGNAAARLGGDQALTLRPEEKQLNFETTNAIESALKTVRRRVDEYGLTQPEVVKQGFDRIRVRIPGETDPERIRKGLLRTAYLEFRLLHPNHAEVITQFTKPGTQIIRDEFLEDVFVEETQTTVKKLKRNIPGVPAGYQLFLGKDTRTSNTGEVTTTENIAYLLENKAEVTGGDLRRASSITDMQDIENPYKVTLEFGPEGTEKFADVTRYHTGEQFAIVLDGEVNSAPRINEPILTGRCEISGNFTQQDAHDLALVLKAGSLQAPLKVIEENAVGASLGQDSIIDSGRALMIGGVAVVIMMIVVYNVAGVVAVLAMLLNVLLILAILSLAGATLTLSGIGGILLTMGMAVDANVLIYERLREELDSGKPMRPAMNAAFGSAFSVILDSNITSLLPALVLILFEVVEGSIRGFWTALAIGLIANLYTGLTVTRALIEVWVAKFKKISVGKLRLLNKVNFDFMAYRKIGYPISLVLIGVSVFYLTVHGVNPGIDFTGGVLATVDAKSAQVERADIQRAVDETFHDAKVVHVLNTTLYQVTVPQAADETLEDIQTTLGSIFNTDKDYMPANSVVIKSTQSVAQTVGAEFQWTAFWTILVASLIILGYIALRFRPVFGMGAVAALLHDLIITLGIFIVLGRSMTLDIVSGLLIVLGYSVNDTIVVFDRIRETMGEKYGRNMKEIINLAINRTLSRTLFTSGSTLLTVLAMLIFGGVGLKDFALVLLLGIITGTYSSIFVASALVDSYMTYREKKEGLEAVHGKKKAVKIGA
ncbi:protein translocase subunit SecD [bacterium]|nr:protein translocase subunit SecD [bacterium]